MCFSFLVSISDIERLELASEADHTGLGHSCVLPQNNYMEGSGSATIK